MKKIILISVLLLVLFIVGCSQKVVCNKPYILVGSECCLDKDDNSICDRDEAKEEPKVMEELPKQEEIKETQETAPVEEYSVYDLQNDLNNVYGGVYTFSKSESKDVNYYRGVLDTNIKEVVDEKNPNLVYYVNVDYRNITIEELKDKGIETFEEFKEYIEKSFMLNKENMANKRELFEEDYKKDFKEKYTLQSVEYAYYRFRDLSKEEILSVDEFRTLEQKEIPIIETLYLSLDNYNFNYVMAYSEDKLNTSSLTSQKKDQFFDFNFEVSILCKPNLVVYLSENKIKKQIVGKYYEKGEVENQIEVIKTKIIAEAEKVAEACS